MSLGIEAPEGELFDINMIRAQADYYAALANDFEYRDRALNAGSRKRFKRAAIALAFMAQFIESHGDQTGVLMVKQWAGING